MEQAQAVASAVAPAPRRMAQASDAATARTAVRIAYLTTKYPAVSHTFIRRELLELERRGHQILRVAIRSAGGPMPDPQDQAEEKRTIHILAGSKVRLLSVALKTILTAPGPALRAIGCCLRLARRSDRGFLRHFAYLIEATFLKNLATREQIQHVHVHFGTNAAAVALLARILGGPAYSIAIHGPDEFDAPIGLSLADKVERAEFITAISSFAAAQVRRWVPPSQWGKVHVVRCTVGDQFFTASPALAPGSQTFLCIGRFNAQKGHLDLIDAFATTIAAGADARLVLAGDGELRAEIESRVAQHRLKDRVEITGWIPETEIRRRISECRAVVLASCAEGLPMVLMEALALGRVVIATSIAGVPELVRPEENGWLVPAGDIQGLSEAMLDVLRAPASRLNELASAGQELVRARHSTSIEAARLEALILAAAGAR